MATAEELKKLLRVVLISSPCAITVDQLERDFLQREGRGVPFRELGYHSFIKYLESIPDTVDIRPSLNGGCPVVVPVNSKKSAHTEKVVLQQKFHPPKQGSGIRLPAQCTSSVNTSPQMSGAYQSTNYSSKNMEERKFLPLILQQRIYKMVYDNPQGMLVKTIEQELISSKVLQNCRIPEGFDIHSMLSQLDHILQISDGMVYPVRNRTPVYRPPIKNAVTDLKGSPDSGSPTDDTHTHTFDLVSKKMRMNFQTLLDKHPNGIWCSELPGLYKKEFAVLLQYTSLGFRNVIHMASFLPDVFYCVEVDRTDCILFDARKKLPPEYAKYKMKNNIHVSTKMVPTVPKQIGLNIKNLLTVHPTGISSELIPYLYEEVYRTTLNLRDFGFWSLEALLLVLQQLNMLRMRSVKGKIFVYPAAQETEPEQANPFPYITEPQDHFLNLYPPEVVGPKGMLTHEKIPPEAKKGAYIEVFVAEIYTPLNFWIQLRGEKTHVALDRLMDDMQRFYQQEAGNYNMPDATVSIGQYCVAPYNKEWHRACITAVHNLFEVQVMFVDYGTTCRLQRSELRFMHTDFAQFPLQAFKASLANLVPVRGGIEWSHEAGVRFLGLVMEKGLIAIISAVDHEARELKVALVDTTGEEDIRINDVLVSEGLAEYKIKPQTSPLPPKPKRVTVVERLFKFTSN